MGRHACSSNPCCNTLLPQYATSLSKVSLQMPPTPHVSSPSPLSPVIRSQSSQAVATIAAITEAVNLASEAVKAAEEAMSLARLFGENTRKQAGHEQQHWEQDDRTLKKTMAAHRRQRRRKRRKSIGLPDDEHEDNDDDFIKFYMHGCSSREERSRYLTSKQEADFSRYLKEEANVETIGNQINEFTASDFGGATTSRIKRRSRDMALLKARECRERITLSYRRLVVAIATPYQGKGLSLQDLVQEGCIGLLRGAQKFDHKKGYKLSTYVYWWIKQAIVRAIANKSRIVRLPGNLCEALKKVAEANSLLRRKLGRSPTYEEVAEFVDMGVCSVRIIIERSRNPISVDQPVNNERMTLQDIIHGPDETTPEAIITRQERSQNLAKLLKTLSDREANIIRLHYGLHGESARSFDEIGRLINLSRERVRQIHWTALTKLQEGKCLIECPQSSL